MKNDLEISLGVTPKPIEDIAAAMGLEPGEFVTHGATRAKVNLDVLDRLADRPLGKYICMTGMTPTPLGEGKTVQTIGASLGLHKLGHRVVTCIRVPSMGPIFGVKGGAAGGGLSQVIPMEDFNLGNAPDIHAVADAHNLLAAFLDNALHKRSDLRIDPLQITWRRSMDCNDRVLRNVVVGLGGKANGIPRETGFDNTAASEIMAILGLSKGYADMRERLGRTVIASNVDGGVVTAEDVKAAGAMAVLLRNALRPNLMQTIEGTPCLAHTGPFANIAHGNSSILADEVALRCADYVVTEAGFGADMGAEKFFNIKCRVSGRSPDAVGIVVTLRALKMHGGNVNIRAGQEVPASLREPNEEHLVKGLENVAKHIENIKKHGVQAVVVVNRFPGDTDAELDRVVKSAKDLGAFDAAISEAHGRGGEGAVAVAEALQKAAEAPSEFRHLYPSDMPIREKIETLAHEIYGADGVDFGPGVLPKIRRYTENGFGSLPICMAKTQYSISHDPKLKGRPRGFRLPIRDIRAAVGAGFLYPLAGDIQTMPGLPTHPAGEGMDIDDKGNVRGLF